MQRKMKNLLLILLAVLSADFGFAQVSYTAAVVEYAPKTDADTLSNRLLENVQEYVNYISEAADEAADIIVFPENGLTGMDVTDKDVDELSIEVPDPESRISPCRDQSYSKALVDLSCAAESHRIYVVVNIAERRNETGNITYHNTNIVFNRDGFVVSRFRKINLFNEPYLKPGNETVTFKTDFGVTFGMFICNDILFKNPALDTLKDLSIADIIYPAAWFSELPFLGSLSVQHGYAVSNQVNLLSAGLSDPSNRNGGSGFFLANGRIPSAYISEAKTSRMLVATIPKISGAEIKKCQPLKDYSTTTSVVDQEYSDFLNWGVLPSISQFMTLQEDMANYTFKSLNLSATNISETICTANRKFCCSINLVAQVSETPAYVYKLVAFNGGRLLGSETIGIRTCGLITCLRENNTTCGLRDSFAPKGVIFKKLLIKWSFPNSKNSHDQPATVNYDLKPINNYTFCKKVEDKNTVITLEAENQSTLLTFGIFGRVYGNDNKGTGLFNSAAKFTLNPCIIFVVSVIIFTLQEW